MTTNKLDKIETKPKNAAKAWAWVATIVLLILATLFILDKLKTSKTISNYKTQRDSISTIYNTYKAETKSIRENYFELQEKYNALNSEFNKLKDSAVLNSGVLTKKQEELLLLQQKIRKQDSIVNIINKVVQDALLGFESDELNVEIRNGKVYVTMQDKLLFKSGSADVEQKGVQALSRLAKVLIKNPDIGVMIEGHTDNVPIKTEKYQDNWDLSVARATSIVRILTNKYNLPSKRITAAGKGEFYPIASNKTKQGKAKNRRTEIILTPNLDELYSLINKKPNAK